VKWILKRAVSYLTGNERGATAVEYALMIALIAAAIILGVTAFGLGLSGEFESNLAEIGLAIGSIVQ
jgi:Flp pilus assembly pilin Flp